MRPDDIDELRRAIDMADEETLRLRFLGGRAPRTDGELRHLVNVDHVRREALAAFTDEGHLIGIARYEALDDTTADVAIVVDPEWRHLGLATALLYRLLCIAVGYQIRTIHVDYCATNREVDSLIDRLGATAKRRMASGVVEAQVTLDAARLAGEGSSPEVAHGGTNPQSRAVPRVG
jgi:GNAT superfamily N-acetyltransferase